MKKKKTLTKISIFFFILILAVVAFFLVRLTFTGLFVPETVGMIQYAGGFNKDIDPWHTVQVGSMTAILGEYKVEVQKDSFRNEPIYSGSDPIYECEGNVCGGVPDYIDGDGCQIWKKTTSGKIVKCGAESPSVCGTHKCPCTTSCDCSYIMPCFGSPQKLCQAWYDYGSSGWYKVGTSQWGCTICQKNVPTTYEYCGGLKPSNIISYCCDYSTCWGKFKIYKDDVLLKETPWIRGGVSLGLDYLADPDIMETYQDKGLVADLFRRSTMRYSSCLRIENAFDYKTPEDAFSFNVTVPEERILEGEEYYAYIEVTNIWKPVKGNLSIVYNVPYKILGFTREAIELDSKIVEIPTGKSSFKYLIPTDMPYEKIYITPTFYVLMDGSDFSGVNGICFGQEDNTVRPLSGCDYVLLGTLYGDKFNVTVVSKVGELEKELISKQLEIELLQKDISDLDALLVEREQTRNDLDDSIDQMNKEILSLESKLNQQTLTIDELEQTLIAKESTVNELEQLILQSQIQIDEMIKIINAKKLKINELLNERLIQEQKIAELLKNLEEKELKFAEIQGLSEEQIAELERIRSLFDEQKVKIDELISIVEKDNQIISEINQSNENQKTIVDELNEENQKLLDKTRELELITELEQQKVDELRQNLEDTKLIVERLKQENEDQKESMERIKQISREQEDLIKKLKQLNNEINEILSKKTFIQKYMWYLIGILAFFLVIALIALATRKPKKKR